MSSAGLQFVVSTSLDELSAETRKKIRSHVMIGKNKGKILPPRKTKATNVNANSTSSRDPRPPPSSATSATGLVAIPGKAQYWITPPLTSIPPKLGSEVSLIQLADDVDPKLVEPILRYAANGKQIMFPLETCLLHERRPSAEAWIPPLASDDAYLHLMIFVSHHFFHELLPRKASPTHHHILSHFVHSLTLLRKRLAQDDCLVKLSYTTAAIVMNLAGIAVRNGDIMNARHHMQAFYTLISTKGGLTYFDSSIKFMLETLRCDITIAIASNSKPVFLLEALSLPYPDFSSYLSSKHIFISTFPFENIVLSEDQDIELLTRAWSTTSDFSWVINSMVQSGQRISTEHFCNTMVAVMYRLLARKYTVGSSREAIRIGLLVFSATIFSCGIFVKSCFPSFSQSHLTGTFKQSLINITASEHSPRLLLWLLMVGSMSVLDSLDEWFRTFWLDGLRLCNIETWPQMRDLLGSFMWIHFLQDDHGEAVFKSLQH